LCSQAFAFVNCGPAFSEADQEGMLIEGCMY
jgi:hypothetical protein